MMKSQDSKKKPLQHLSLLSHQILPPLAQKGKRIKIAIIGNAGANKQDQEAVKQADLVVRFNNYATREGISHTEDRFRCDILFTHMDLHSMGCKPKHVVIGIPYPFKAKDIIQKSERWYSDSKMWMVNPYLNLQLCDELGLKSDGFAHPLPSLGFTALWHLQDFPCDFYIGGFNWYHRPVDGTIQNLSFDKAAKATHFNHYYLKEANWIFKNLYPKLNIKFSDYCQQALHSIQRHQF